MFLLDGKPQFCHQASVQRNQITGTGIGGLHQYDLYIEGINPEQWQVIGICILLVVVLVHLGGPAALRLALRARARLLAK